MKHDCGSDRRGPPRQLHRHQPEMVNEACRPLLQPQGEAGTVDPGGQGCRQVGQAAVPAVQGQRIAAAVVRPGVQPGQLPASTGAAQADLGMDADDAVEEVDQDRGQGGEELQVCPLPVGGSRRAAAVVRPDSGADRPLVPRLCFGMRLGRSGKRVRKASPGVRGAQRGAFSRSPCQRRVHCGTSGPRRERSGVQPGGKIVAPDPSLE